MTVASILAVFTCDCESTDGSPLTRRRYRVTGFDGSAIICSYCADCAALARINWNGETSAIVDIEPFLPREIHEEDAREATERARDQYNAKRADDARTLAKFCAGDPNCLAPAVWTDVETGKRYCQEHAK